jgi:hypothetical protein
LFRCSHFDTAVTLLFRFLVCFLCYLHFPCASLATLFSLSISQDHESESGVCHDVLHFTTASLEKAGKQTRETSFLHIRMFVFSIVTCLSFFPALPTRLQRLIDSHITARSLMGFSLSGHVVLFSP